MMDGPLGGTPTESTPDVSPFPRRRPVTVWAATAVLVLLGLLLAFVSVVLFAAIDNDQSDGSTVSTTVWLVLALYVALAAGYIVLGVFLFRGANWARVTTAVIAGLNVIVGLFAVGSAGAGIGGCLGLAFPIGLLALMFNRDVRAWCES